LCLGFLARILELRRPDGRGDCFPPNRFTTLYSQIWWSCSLNFFRSMHSLSHIHSASFSGDSVLKCAPKLKNRVVFDETKHPDEFPECTSAVLMFIISTLLMRLAVFWVKGRKASGLRRPHGGLISCGDRRSHLLVWKYLYQRMTNDHLFSVTISKCILLRCLLKVVQEAWQSFCSVWSDYVPAYLNHSLDSIHRRLAIVCPRLQTGTVKGVFVCLCVCVCVTENTRSTFCHYCDLYVLYSYT